MKQMRMTLLLLSGLLNLPFLEAQASPLQCFDKASNSQAQYEVLIDVVPPLDSKTGQFEATSSSYPATSFASWFLNGPLPKDPSNYKPTQSILLWVNRCNFVKDSASGKALTLNATVCANPNGGSANTGVVPANDNDYDPAKVFLDDGGNEIAPVFSNYANANECSVLQLMNRLHSTPAYLTKKLAADVARQSASSQKSDGQLKLSLWFNQTLAGIPNSGLTKLLPQTRKVDLGTSQVAKNVSAVVDTCILNVQSSPSDLASIWLDYEVFDMRSEAQALALFKTFHSYTQLYNKSNGAHVKLVLVGDALAPTDPAISLDKTGPSGVDWGSAYKFLQIVDTFVIPVGSGASPVINNHPAHYRLMSPVDNYTNAVKVLTQDGHFALSTQDRSKLVFGVDLYDTHLDEASSLQKTFKDEGYQGVRLSRDGAAVGGDCQASHTVQESPTSDVTIPTNQVIACLSTGNCTGTFGN